MKIIQIIISIVLAGVFSSHAQNGIQPTDLHSIQIVAETAVSPDGKWIAYTLSVPRPLEDGSGSAYRQLWLYNVEKKTSQTMIGGAVSITSIQWHPDGKRICFRAAMGNSKSRQIYAMDPNSSDPVQLTNLDRSIIAYDFIDKNTIALTVTEKESKAIADIKAEGYDMKIVEENIPHIELLKYNVSSGQLTTLTRGVTVFDFTISPDGKKVAAAIAPANLVDHSFMFKRIHIINVEDGKVLEVIQNPGKLSVMKWSPDNKKLAFIAASDLSDAVSGSLFIFETGKGIEYSEIRNYTQGMELSAVNLIWTDNETVMYVAEAGTDIIVRQQKISDKGSSLIVEGGKACFKSFEISDGFIWFAGHTPHHPSELMRINIKTGETEKLSNHNSWLSNIKLAQQKKITYKARDGKEIEGVLIYPLHYAQGKQYPLIVYIHGGPEACVQNGWITHYSQWGQFAASRDYFVFYPNYRASSGRGVEFTMQGYGDLLGKEYDDVIDGIDYLIEQGLVDKERVGIGGGSYGGYFAAWSATKHTDRFAAAVVFVGVTNQVSKRNLTDIPYEDYYVHWGFWTHENFDKVWEASPVKYAQMSNTPTLILHGEEDPRIPISQGYELFRSLKLHGKAAVRMLTYPGEGHGNAKNFYRYDYLVRTLEWFDFYLKDNNDKTTLPDMYPKY